MITGNKILILITFLIVLLIQGNILVAEGKVVYKPDIDIYVVGDTQITAEGKNLLTSIFTVVNNTDKDRELTPNIELPKGWTLTFPAIPVNLPRYSSDIVIVSFSIPLNTPSGNYRVKCTVDDKNAYITVKILEINKIQIIPVSSPQNVIAGESYNCKFLLINKGNSNKNILLKIKSKLPYKLISVNEKDGIDVLANNSKEVTFEVFSSEKIDKSFQNIFKVTASLTDKPNITSSAKNSVEIIPIKPKGDNWHKYPIFLNIKSAFQDNEEINLTSGAKLYGGGSLDDKGEHKLDFSLLPPILDNKKSGDYFLKYQNKNISIKGGTNTSFQTSKLTSGNSSGKGVEGSLTLGKISVTSFFAEKNPLTDKIPVTGISFKFNINDVNSIKIDSFKKYNDTNYTPIGIKTFLRPYDSANIKFEAATDIQKPQNYAYILETSIKEKKFSCDINLDNYTPGFKGENSDRNSLSCNSNLILTPNSKITAGTGYVKNNLELIKEKGSANYEKVIKAGFYYYSPSRLLLSTGWRRLEKKDLLNKNNSKEQRDTFLLKTANTWSRLRGSAELEFSRNRNYSTNNIYWAHFLAFNLTYAPNISLKFKNTISFNSGASKPGISDSSLAYNMELNYTLGQRTKLTSSFNLKKYITSLKQSTTSINLNLNHTFQNKGSILFNCSYCYNIIEKDYNDLRISLNYTHPFYIPVSKRTNIGTVSGKIINKETSKGISEVIVYLDGESTLTDSSGYFIFPSVKEGYHKLKINTSRLNQSYILSNNSKTEVNVRGRKESTINIEVYPSIDLKGRIIKYSRNNKNFMPGSNKEIVEDGGLNNVLLEISNSKIKHRVITSNNGNFLFKGLTPGDWKLNVFSEYIPTSHYIEKSTYQIKITENSNIELIINALPVQRIIQFQQTGETIEIK